MQINPVLTPLQLGDRLHLFASSAAAAASALDCLQSDAAFDCALNARLGAPLTTRALPTALALLTIIPEREEDPRNPRGARGSEEMPRSRSLGALRSVEEADEKWVFFGGDDMQDTPRGSAKPRSPRKNPLEKLEKLGKPRRQTRWERVFPRGRSRK